MGGGRKRKEGGLNEVCRWNNDVMSIAYFVRVEACNCTMHKVTKPGK